MPNKFAINSGFFNNANIWSTSPSSYLATTVPGPGDIAYPNGHIIQINNNVTCDGIYGLSTNSSAPSGRFYLNNNITVNCSVSGIIGNSEAGKSSFYEVGNANVSNMAFLTDIMTGLIWLTGGNSASVTSRIITGGSRNFSAGIVNDSSGNLYVTATTLSGGGGSGSPAIVGGARSKSFIVTTTIDGSVRSNANFMAINNLGGYMNIVGNIIGSNAAGSSTVRCKYAGNLFITGSVVGGLQASGILLDSSGTSCYIVGNCVASDTFYAINDSNVSTTFYPEIYAPKVTIAGNIINNTKTGRQALFLANYSIVPTSNTYIIQNSFPANNGMNSSAAIRYYTTDTLGVFSIPPANSVRAGVRFASNTQIGTCEIPSVSAVSIGVNFDSNNSKIGIAYNSANAILNTLVTILSTDNSIGSRLIKTATIESTGHLIASFTN